MFITQDQFDKVTKFELEKIVDSSNLSDDEKEIFKIILDKIIKKNKISDAEKRDFSDMFIRILEKSGVTESDKFDLFILKFTDNLETKISGIQRFLMRKVFEWLTVQFYLFQIAFNSNYSNYSGGYYYYLNPIINYL